MTTEATSERKISEAERHGRTLTTVELLTPYRNPMGAVWAAGERAGFPDAEARDLIRRGVARPPVDKQVKGDRTQTK